MRKTILFMVFYMTKGIGRMLVFLFLMEFLITSVCEGDDHIFNVVLYEEILFLLCAIFLFFALFSIALHISEKGKNFKENS